MDKKFYFLFCNCWSTLWRISWNASQNTGYSFRKIHLLATIWLHFLHKIFSHQFTPYCWGAASPDAMKRRFSDRKERCLPRVVFCAGKWCELWGHLPGLVGFPRIEVYYYCWWFRNPAITSWVEVGSSSHLQSFLHPRVVRRISEPSTFTVPSVMCSIRLDLKIFGLGGPIITLL